MAGTAIQTAQGIAPAVRAAAQGLVLTSMLGLASGYVSVLVEPLTQQHYPPRNGNEPIQAFSVEPFRPSVKLARIVATSQTVDEDALRERILTRARLLGADAVVLGKVDVLESIGASPLYESTLSPASAGYGPVCLGARGMVGSLLSGSLELRARGGRSEGVDHVFVWCHHPVRAVSTDGRST